MRARLAITVSTSGCVLREVQLSAKPEAMLAASPKATVPVLVLPDCQVIDERLEIMRWAGCNTGASSSGLHNGLQIRHVCPGKIDCSVTTGQNYFEISIVASQEHFVDYVA